MMWDCVPARTCAVAQFCDHCRVYIPWAEPRVLFECDGIIFVFHDYCAPKAREALEV